MREAFFSALLESARGDDRVFLVVGDLGFSVVDRFAEEFPGRFVNAGVAEQNMIALAAGLALSGKIVFTYSIANFTVFRCLEQIRNDVCYHNLDVKICAVGGGFAYGALGFSHHATEDLAVMRALPNMTVVAPGDPVEAALATRAVAAAPGPCYLRLGRSGEQRIHAPEIPFRIGQAILTRAGRDLTFISTGGVLDITLQVAQRLADRGFSARVLSMHTLKPIDTAAVRSAAKETRAIVTVEEHTEVGGLRGAVAEVLCEMPSPGVATAHIAVPAAFSSVSGSQEYLREMYGLSVDGILTAIAPILDRVVQERRSAPA